ncbi:ABC transporter substrate-binding protein [Bradyrhizobium sp. UFLA05-109]
MPVIGLLDGRWGHLNEKFESGVRDNGINGFEVQFSRRAGPGYQADHLARYGAAFFMRQPDVIIAYSDQAALAAKTVTSTTPIIFLADDPVATGLVESLDRPGGNLTGVACPVTGFITRRIKILRQLVPQTSRVVLVTDPTNKPTNDIEIREAQAAADAFGFELLIIAWTGEHLLEPELAALPRDRKAVLVFGGGLPFFIDHALLAYLARLYGMPAIHDCREAVEEGGLASFGTRFADGGYMMGSYAARVLKGEKPADLAVQKITNTELVLNLHAAKSFGLQIPSTLLACADEVIE